MDFVVITLGWIGIYGVLALGAIGSIIGCARAGQAACGALLETESGYGRYIAVSAMPSSQIIYGIVTMFALQTATGAVNATTAPGLFAVGILAGLVLLFSAVLQGEVCAAAINVSKSKPEIFGLSIAPAAIVEGFAVFAFVFALVLSGTLPSATGS